MPITYDIDRARRLVIATPRGVLTDAEVFDYQQAVWSHAEQRGYNELVDMTGVSEIKFLSAERIDDLAKLSTSMDGDAPSKLAFVATDDAPFVLSRMFQTCRDLYPQSKKVVQVFRNRAEALAWLEFEKKAE